MPDTIDELYKRWQANPADVTQTVSLCDALSHSPGRIDLVEIVGSHASRSLDVRALVAAARMYLGIGRFDDAQSALLAAGRLAPRDGDVYRWLGEVLLRRGDAERAEKVLERAVQFGASEPQTSQLLADARKLAPTQKSSGMIAVADEIAKSSRNGAIPKLNADDSDKDIETLVRKGAEVKPIVDIALGPAKPVPAAGLPPPMPPPKKEETELPGLAAPQPMFGTYTPEQTGRPQTSLGIGVMQTEPAAPVSAPALPVPSSSRREPEIPVNPMLLKPPKEVGGQRVPEPRDVLEALQVAGIFEPDGAVRPLVWDKPERGRRRVWSTIIVAMMSVLAIGGGIGTFQWVKTKRAQEHIEAEAQLARIDVDLRTSDAALLDPAEKGLVRAFDLESRSPHAALTWLHERAMVGFLSGGDSVAFEDATARAREVGVEEKRLAFAGVASFLFQNDTAGAASAVAKGAAVKADEDAWYQLVAGATFERAGDAHALERYEAATKLDPELLIAQILLVRAMAVDGDPQRANELAKDFRAKHQDRIESAALVALAWARDPMKGEPPPEVQQILDSKAELPVPLRAVPHAARAVIAIEKHDIDQAKPALQKGLAVADTPGIAAWLGSIALGTGDEGLARKAALQAVSFSAVYPPARVLAARVALLGARLDEALKAAEDLPPSSPDVAVVAAAVAYEKLDRDGMARALDAVDGDAKKLPFLAPLQKGLAVLSSTPNALSADKTIDFADGEDPWGDIIAMDFALDAGDVDLAHKVTSKWVGDVRGLRAARLARLARYEGKSDDADRLSKIALDTGTVTTRVLAERVFALVDAKKEKEALALFKSYPNVGGPLVKWLRAYAIASGGGKMEEARAIVSSEDPPPPLAPLPARTYAAMAYGALKDMRHGREYVSSIANAGFANPDIAAAADRLNLPKPTHRR
ncbi:MAG TPA: tetratricopeptide repeat protein [Labilithrix sp.]